MKWTVRVDGSDAKVMGFRQATKARSHAYDHFLNPSEHWETTQPRTPPAAFRERLQADEDEDDVLDDASEHYVWVVRRETQAEAGRVGYHVPENSRGFEAIKFATPHGVFCAFARAAVSGLATAFRPSPSWVRGKPTLRQFQDEARRRRDRDY